MLSRLIKSSEARSADFFSDQFACFAFIFILCLYPMNILDVRFSQWKSASYWNSMQLFNKFHFHSTDLVRDLTEKAKKYDSKDASKWLARVSVCMCTECLALQKLIKFQKRTKNALNNFVSLQALQYNVPCGKKNRGLATVLAYKSLIGNEAELTPENVRLAHYLGWCVEMVSVECLIIKSVLPRAHSTLARDKHAVRVGKYLFVLK